MNYIIYSNPDELYHHGVKGMRWGVRHDPEGGAGRAEAKSRKEAVKTAKKDYKAAKKAYNKSFNKWYYKHPKIHITQQGKHKEQRQLVDTLEKSNDLAIARGKYMQAKGVARNKPKMVAKGKYIVTAGKNNKAYNVKVSSLMDKGYSLSEAASRNVNSYNTTVRKNEDAAARYRKEVNSIKKG